MDNFITEYNTINPNCDADFINSKLTIILMLLCLHLCLTIYSTDFCETEFNTHIYDGKTLRKVFRQPKTISKQLPKEPDMNHGDTVLAKTLKEIAAQKEKTLLRIAANQERAEERRHQETMTLIRELGNNNCCYLFALD